MTINNNSGLNEDTIKKLLSVFSHHPCILAATLYGSRAKGNYTRSSDIDLCLTAPDMTYSQLVQVNTELDDLLLPYSIDLSLRHHIENQDLLEHIARVGIPLTTN